MHSTLRFRWCPLWCITHKLEIHCLSLSKQQLRMNRVWMCFPSFAHLSHDSILPCIQCDMLMLMLTDLVFWKQRVRAIRCSSIHRETLKDHYICCSRVGSGQSWSKTGVRLNISWLVRVPKSNWPPSSAKCCSSPLQSSSSVRYVWELKHVIWTNPNLTIINNFPWVWITS